MKGDFLAAALFPTRCCICDAVQEPLHTLCPACSALLLRNDTGGARCSVCGLRRRDCICANRLCYETLSFPFYYDGPVREALQRFKFRQRVDLAKPFAAEMAAEIRRRGAAEAAELICFVPMRRFARWRRGYNQAELLAKELGDLLGKPVYGLLTKQKTARRQHRLSAAERRGNLLGVFEPTEKTKNLIAGKRILLADDICTTCSTLNEAAKTLMIFGAERVDCVCVAARPRKKKPEQTEKTKPDEQGGF